MGLYFGNDDFNRLYRRLREQPGTCRPACPDCHTIHTVPKNIAGAHLWDVCPDCLRKIDEQTRKTLAERGVVLS